MHKNHALQIHVAILFFSERQNVELPQFGRYATGILFLDQNSHQEAEAIFEKLVEECNLRVWFILSFSNYFFRFIALHEEFL